MLEYARAVSGDFSLFEIHAGKGDLTLVDAAFADAARLPGDKERAPKAGYYVKLLTGQGPNAPGGQQSYLTPGPDGKNMNMTKGYAVVVWPAQWDKTGRLTYVLNNHGTVYQKDLGPDTAKLVAKMRVYNPDSSWVISD